VLLRLDVVLRTPSPLPVPPAWESQTPSNARELELQSSLVRTRIRAHQDSSPLSIIQAIDRFTKGAERMVHEAVLLREEAKSLRAANEAATKRRSRKKKRIQQRGTLIKAAGADIVA
jgi:hypothetical protein